MPETDGRADGEREGGGEEETAGTHTSGSPGDRGQGRGDRPLPSPQPPKLRTQQKEEQIGEAKGVQEGRPSVPISGAGRQTNKKGQGVGVGASMTTSSPCPPPRPPEGAFPSPTTDTDRQKDRQTQARMAPGGGRGRLPLPPHAGVSRVWARGRGGGALYPVPGAPDPHAGPRLRPARQTDRRTMDPGFAARATPGPGPFRAGAGRALAGPCAGILRTALQTDKASGRQTDGGGKRWRRERRERAARAPASGAGGEPRARAGAAPPPPSSPLAAAAGSSSSFPPPPPPPPRGRGRGGASLRSPPPNPFQSALGVRASLLLYCQVQPQTPHSCPPRLSPPPQTPKCPTPSGLPARAHTGRGGAWVAILFDKINGQMIVRA
ncbi:transcription initiation factor TFIID subunit 4-like [Dromiciops gliroides]|uniref:transcription initiation factor TFIID subunit 4-like n=1 Tax=Dromiciops gliroides TaxID=33562 RepID=UPI001CC3F475|nr:transcription initiation factor TFIID subunit 4-like [Dromiciops gliroides]